MHRKKLLTGLVIVLLFSLLLSLFPPLSSAAVAESNESPLLQPVPSVSVNTPAQVFIGDIFSFSVVFDNTSLTDVGYGPYIDVFLPKSGMDGTTDGEKEDGITFASADYLGANIRTWQYECEDGGELTHPLTGLVVTCPSAPIGAAVPFLWQFVVAELPFGSFAPDQPPAPVTFNALLSDFADLNAPLPIYAQGGYRFGVDALDNPTADPPIIGARISADVNPTLFILAKEYNWREDETPTGPNYPRRYTITLEIPEGQTINNLVISDQIPENMQFLSLISTDPEALGCSLPSTSVPGGELSCSFDSITGAAGADATIIFEFYISLYDSGGTRVINPQTGGCVISENAISAVADWQPLDPRDPVEPISETEDPAHTLEDCSHTIQKFQDIILDTPPAGYSPNDVIEYRLEFQISDYFAYQDFIITDVISDGHRFDAAFTPTLQVSGNGYVLNEGIFQPGNFDVVPNYTPASPAPNDGTTTVTFSVSDEVISRGQSGRLIGGCVSPAGIPGGEPDCAAYNDGPTTGIIRFRTVVQDDFSDDFPSGDPSVDQGDRLTNSVTAAGSLLNNEDLSPTGSFPAENSFQAFVIEYGSKEKSIYAVNGNTAFNTPVWVTPFDTITYRLVYNLNTSDVEDLELIDYLPLPVLDSDEISGVDDVISATPPAAGRIQFGPTDTFRNYSGIVPALAIDALNNSFSLTYGTFDDPQNLSTTIDLLFTVTVSEDPFADELYLTNQAIVYEGSTNFDDFEQTSIVQIILAQPELTITKGAVSSDRLDAVFIPDPPAPSVISLPGGGCPRFNEPITSSSLALNPVNSNIRNLDAGDRVTFMIVLENSGHNGAYDVSVRDDLPPGFAVPAGGLNLCVTDGSGVQLGYFDLGGGLLGTGIELDDPAGGALAPGFDFDGSPNENGSNIAIITFDLELADGVVPGEDIINTAALFNYAGTEGGPDHTADDRLDTAETRVLEPAATKTLTDTSQGHTAGNNLVIGETATFDLAIRVPEGLTPGSQVIDSLPSGLAFVDCVSITTSSGNLTTSLGGGFDAACDAPTNPTVASAGGLVTFNLGDLTNSDRDNSTDETLTIRFRAVVLNIPGNQNGSQLDNQAQFTWEDGSINSTPARVIVVEPALTVVKTALPTTGDAGDTIVFTITVTNPAGGVDAFDVSLGDIVPDKTAFVPGSFFLQSGLAPDSIGEDMTPFLYALWNSFPAGQSATLQFSVVLDGTVSPGDVIRNTAVANFTSLPGAPGQQSPYNDLSYERTGNASDPGGTANDYSVFDDATISVVIPTPIKYLVATSEAHTAGSSVAIGEIVRYRLSTRIPEGTSNGFQIRDLLPPGLLFVDDGTARFAFVSNGPIGITSSTLGCVNTNGSSGDPSAIPGSQVACVFPAGSITNAGTGNPFASGSDPWFNFGNLTNADDDIDLEFIIIEFNALVLNISGNQAGTIRANDFLVYVGEAQVADAQNLNVTVVEPNISVNKTVSAGPYDGGDPITYTIAISNAGANTAVAFDLNVQDVFDASIQVQSITIDAPVPSVITDRSSGNTLDFDVSRLNVGDTITVTINALIPPDVPAFLNIPNTVDVIYTSLPGDNGTVVNDTGSSNTGVPGEQTGERTGQDGPGGLNDYAGSSQVNLSITQPSIDKRDADPTVYTIGEEVVYPIIITLPEGITRSLTVVDDLPVGLEYVRHAVVDSAADSGGFLTEDFSGSPLNPIPDAPGGSGGDLTLSFGDVTTTADSGDPAPDNNRFLIFVTARVMDIPSNQSGTILANVARLTFSNPNTQEPETIGDDPVFISLIEPLMTISKTFDPDAVTINGTTQVTLVVENVGTSPAHDVIIEDPFPSALFQSVSEVTTPVDFAFASELSAGNWVVRYSGGPIEAGGSRIFVFTVTASNDFPSGTIFENTATVTRATTLPGDNEYERDAPDVSARDDLTSISPDLEIDKSDGLLEITPGEVSVYTIIIRNTGQHEAVNITVGDEVPAGTSFNLAQSTPGWSCADGAPAGSLCQFNIASLDIGAQISIEFALRVDNPIAAGTGFIRNTASVTDDGSFGVDPTPENNSDDDVTIIQDAYPQLIASKVDALLIDADSSGNPSAGDTLRYTVTITNSGSRGAGGVVFSDTPDANTTLLVGSVTASQGVITSGNTAGDAIVEVQLGEIAGAGGSANVVFDVVINDPLGDDVSWIANQGLVSGDNFDDLPTDDPDAPGNSDPTVTLLQNAFSKILLSTNMGFTEDLVAAIGEVVTYQVTLVIPAGRSLSAVLRDTLDRGLAYVDCFEIASSSPDLTTDLVDGFDAACASPLVQAEPPGSANTVDQGRVVEFDLGTLTNASINTETVTLVYRAVVLNSAQNQTGVRLGNEVVWFNPLNNLTASSEPVRLVEPVMEVLKSANKTSAAAGEAVTFTLTVRHTAASRTDAFDVELVDALPANLEYIPGSFSQVSGFAALLDDSDPGNLRASWGSYPSGAGTAVLQFRARVVRMRPGQSTTNSVQLSWTSLPGDLRDPQSDFNLLSTERFYDPPSDVNIYGDSDSLIIQAPQPTPPPAPPPQPTPQPTPRPTTAPPTTK